jgi:SAM-dependent methyltransferase
MTIDWYQHYLEKYSLIFNHKTFSENLKTDQPYILLMRKYLKPKARILECGCGLGRAAASMSFNGYKVTAIDHDFRILKIAKKNAEFGGYINFILMNFFDIDKVFERDSFDCCTHQGVLEHYPEKEIRMILERQLVVAKYIIFSIPLDTKFNRAYFDDSIYRNLRTKNYWIDQIFNNFKLIETKTIRQRTDNLLVVIRR